MSRRPRDEMKRALELVGLGNLSGAFTRAFALMSVAEEEILAACRRYPTEVKALWNCFGILTPGELADGAPELYRHHCRELLDRVAEGCEDIRPATRAEICWMIGRMSQASRLDRDVELLGLTITDEIFPGHDLVDGRETYPGSLKEVEREFRKKLAKPERQIREDLRDPPKHFLAEL